MRIKHVTILFFLFTIVAPKYTYTQHKLLTSIKKYTLLEKTPPRSNFYSNFLTKADFYNLTDSERAIILSKKPEQFQQDFTINDKQLSIVFEKTEFLSPGFHIITNEGKTYYPDLGQFVYYRGKVQGEKDTWATLSISNNDVKYLIAMNEGNYEINRTKEGIYAGYFSKDQLQNDKNTDHHEDNLVRSIHRQSKGSRIGNCIEVAVQCDYFTFQQLGSTINVETWVRAVFSDVSSVYALHNVTLVLSQIFVYTSPDPYASLTNLAAVRTQFVNTIQNNYSGRIAVLMSQRQLGGGLANGIGGFCNTYPTYPGPQCITTNLTLTNTPFPNYSYNTYLVAHEIGHVMGLRHTHACVWNGTFTQIDDCGNSVAIQNGDTPEGITCFNINSPILPSNGGTIMSQCNQVSGVGVNLNLGFGTLPGQLLYDNFVFADCFTGNTCSGIAPVNDLCLKAINLPVTNTCENQTFTNQNATATNGPPSFTCGNPGTTINDVWYKVTIPSSGNITIATTQPSGGLSDVLIQAYSGSCAALTTIACDDNSGPGDHALLNITGRTSGEVIFIRLVETGSNEQGTFNICAYDVSVPCHPDYATMIAFYNATGGASWTTKTGWQAGAAGTNCNVCSWYGVQCNELNRVSIINLTSNNVTAATLPSSITALTYLTELRLYNNHISGTIPGFLASFSYLNTIDFGNNLLTGTIPAYFGSMPKLKNLYLDGNSLSGQLPSSLTNIDLSLIYVNNNTLTGCIPAGYSEFCSKSYNFSGNPGLAGGIPFATYCNNGNGGDEDSDGYCQALGDCDDDDNTVFPGNPEVCDLKDNDCNNIIDDIAAPLTNTWIAGTGDWHTLANWSLGIIPERCHNVVISGANGITISINNANAVARSITVNAGKTLQIANTRELKINHGLNIVNQGSIINNGNIIVNNIITNTFFGISNTGTIINNTTGTILIQNSGERSLSNNIGGVLTNNGSLTIDRHVNNTTSTGLYNFGTLTNSANLTVRNIVGNDIRIAPGSSFTNQLSGTILIE